MEVTYDVYKITTPDNETVRLSGFVFCNDGWDSWPRSLPKLLQDAMVSDIDKSTWKDYKWEVVGKQTLSFTLGEGDGISTGSRHYSKYPDRDSRNGIEDKSYDKYGLIRHRPMKDGDIGYEGPDKM